MSDFYENLEAACELVAEQLKADGSNALELVKELRGLTGLGLKEAADHVARLARNKEIELPEGLSIFGPRRR